MPSSPRALEDLTQHYGRVLFDLLEVPRPLLLTPPWWHDLFLRWLIHEPNVKTQLFRLLDVLPTLHTDQAIVRHLREYFLEAADHLPQPLRFLIEALPESGFFARLIARFTRFQARHTARQFIAGETVAEALQAISRLRQRQLAFTLDLLGEAVLTESEAEQYLKRNICLLEQLSQYAPTWPEINLIDRDFDDSPFPRINLSIKLSSFYSRFDPIDPVTTIQEVEARLRPLLETAYRLRAFIYFDMEQYAYKDLTLDLFTSLLSQSPFRDWPHVGIALQAYLRDTPQDLERLTQWVSQRGTPIWIRLVKGAYWDYEVIVAAQKNWPVPVWLNKWQTDAQFEQLTERLLQSRLLRPAIASHNLRSLAHALAAAEYYQVPAHFIEFQVLYGMGDPIADCLVRLDQRVRVYTPFGELLPGVAYLVRRLLENTSNQSFLRATLVEQLHPEELLTSPEELAMLTSTAPPKQAPLDMVSPPALEVTFRNEPHSDFSRAEARQAMFDALAQVNHQLGREYPPIINGKPVFTNQRTEIYNPSHKRQLLGIVHFASISEAEQAIQAAVGAFPKWRDTPVHHRATLLRRLADWFAQRRYLLAAWQVYECGKPWREADADVTEAIDFCRYYALEMERLSQPRRRDVPGELNEYFYEPRGVCVVIAPWNFPLAILTGMTTAALVTGNTVIMKPAEQSSIVASWLMTGLQEVGFPPGVVHYLPGQGELIGPYLVSHRDVHIIAFTGSRAVGLAINQLAAQTPPGQHHVKRVIAEMGGKNAIIIDDDADLDEAIDGVIYSAFGYQGQKCSACSRLIVLHDIYKRFLERLVDATKSLRIAPAEDPSCDLGPVISAEAQSRILEAIKQAYHDAELAYAGSVGALVDEGYYVAPHIFINVPPHCPLAQEEIFGPVLAVMKADSLDEALTLANGVSYALTGGFYSRSPAHIARVRREFRVGNLYINRPIVGALVDRQPFGGFKLSGIGSKAGGPDYLLQFLLPRTITENTMRHGFAPLQE
ncbi:MAG: L-glutamate gamma-semialdehyde dehydrogenase [Gemmatales bacterium]|nr:L-glutamate gamma-semialdehyde dehydrogenase [Gemmatales bacterium]